MTVSTTDSQIDYSTGGPSFPIPFKFLRDEDIQPVLTLADGSQVVLTQNVQYTLTGSGNEGGGTLTSAYAQTAINSGALLRIARIMQPTQETDLRNQGRYFAETHERVFDRLTMLIQQALTGVGNSLSLNSLKNRWDFKGLRGVNVGDPIDPKDVAHKGYVDSSNAAQDSRIDALSAGLPGTNYAFPWSTTTTTGTKTLNPGFEFSSATLYINGIAQTFGKSFAVSGNQIVLAQAVPAGTEIYAILGQSVIPTPAATNPFDLYDYPALRGYTGNASVIHITKPGIEGFFAITEVAGADDQGAFILDGLGRRWARLYEGDVFPEWFGAVGDGVTNDAPAFQRAINLVRLGGGGTVRFDGRYLIDNNLFVEDWVALEGSILSPGELRFDGTSDYDNKRSLLILNSSATITIRSGSSVGGCLVMRKGLDLPFADLASATAGVAAFAGTAFTAGGSDTYIHNMLVLGFNKVFYSNNFERPRVDHIQADCTNGIELLAVFDIAYVDRVHLWPFTTTHRTWTTGAVNSRSGTGFRFANVGDWNKLTNCFTYGYAKGFSIEGCNFVNMVGCGTDGDGSAASTSIGFELIGITKMATMVACQTAAQGYGVVINNNVGNLNGTAALTEIIGCSFWDNDIKHVDVRSGRVNFTSNGLWRCPIGIDVAVDARANIDCCDFEDITAGAISSGSFDNLNIGPSNRFTNCVNNFGQRSVLEANPRTLQQYSGGTVDGIAFQPRRSRGTTAAKAAVQNNDFSYQIDPYAYDGSNFISLGGLRQTVASAVAANNMASKWIMSARAQGAGSPADRWVWDGDGSFTPVGDNTQALGKQANRWQNVYGAQFRPGAGNVIWTSGAGTPEGSVTAVVGSMYTRTDGAAATTLYIKETGTGNTGWIAK